MKLSDLIEEYIREVIAENDIVEFRRSDIATKFNCVPSQINYVLSTRFIPELGFYVESRRGGGGYIKISRIDLSKKEYLSQILDKIGSKLSQSVVDVYLKELTSYNILDEREARLVKIAVSDKSLIKVDNVQRDYIRADIFKNLLINIV